MKKLTLILLLLPYLAFGDSWTELRDVLKVWEERGTTKKVIAKKLDVSYSTLCDFLSSRTKTSPTVLIKYKRYEHDKKKSSLVINSRALSALQAPRRRLFRLTKRSVNFSHILIPARGYKDSKDAKGIFYDHFVFQRATEHETRALIAGEQSYPFTHLTDYIKQNPYGVRFGLDVDGKIMPSLGRQRELLAGLLVIPGRMRDRELDPIREEYENSLIREALRRGQPILALCAGSWRLWEAGRQLTEYPDYVRTVSKGLISVRDHANSRMMSFSQSTGKIVYNTGMHEVKIEDNSLLGRLIKGEKYKIKPPQILTVNSVHWKAVDEEKIPSLFTVSARSIHNEQGVKAPRLGLIRPEGDVVEAFESSSGAPLIGIQWHPEAYNPNETSQSQYHLNILKYMAKAGDTYFHKQEMLREFKSNNQKL